MKRVLLIASNGGHYVQASRLAPAFEGADLTVVSTSIENPLLIDGDYFSVVDCNMEQYLACIICFFQCLLVYIKQRPEVVISTGAAPGLMMLLVAKFTFTKSIWIDSIANTKELSKAGKIARLLTKHCYSQWKNVASSSKVKYMGAVI